MRNLMFLLTDYRNFRVTFVFRYDNDKAIKKVILEIDNFVELDISNRNKDEALYKIAR